MYQLHKINRKKEQNIQPPSAAEQFQLFVVLFAVCTITNIIVSIKQNINSNLKHVPLKLNKNNQVIVTHVTNINIHLLNESLK